MGGGSHLELGCLSLALHLSRKQKSMAKWKKVSLTLLLFYFLTIVTERERRERLRVSVICDFLFCYKMQVLEHQASKHIGTDVSRPPLLRCPGELFLLLCYAVEKFIRLISTFSCCSIQVCPASRVFCTEPHMGVMKNLRGDCSY